MDRKEIIKALGDHFGIKPKYMGAPSFAYQFETSNGVYSVDQAGKVTDPEGNEVELNSLLTSSESITEPSSKEGIPSNENVSVKRLSSEGSSHGGSPDGGSASVDSAAESTAQDVEIDISLEGHNGLTLRNLVNLIYSKQELIAKAVGFTGNIIEEDFLTAIHDANVDTIEKLMATIIEVADKSCPGITFDFESRRAIFKFFQGEHDDEKIISYMQFVELLNNTAKTLKYASSKSKGSDNDKFTFRLFLIRLGMKGDLYKIARKVLLERLEGNSAFRYGSKSEKAVTETAENAS
ncbi:hypothetical protein PCCS19_21590 [Paenibacillus sp. CCS19]|uniref:hypothetical protein n=1 Tax=Paenibacillus sp. CCS19 TaxID=3158387 RepID=UPI002569E391|nr:hypothetical protein [Paenibacillus cellulosilyticus]GMK39105.1 hypothetical protein PCCS19_21590 [Paenibacillus cellulosilyticus]